MRCGQCWYGLGRCCAKGSSGREALIALEVDSRGRKIRRSEVVHSGSPALGSNSQAILNAIPEERCARAVVDKATELFAILGDLQLSVEPPGDRSPKQHSLIVSVTA
jgi:hypothetical protein